MTYINNFSMLFLSSDNSHMIHVCLLALHHLFEYVGQIEYCLYQQYIIMLVSQNNTMFFS